MSEQRDRNFWADVFKWFLIWNFLYLLFKGFVFVCKVIIIAMQHIIYLIIIGIKKLIPIVKAKIEQFKIDYAQNYKPKIEDKISQVKQFFFNMRSNLKNKINALKIKSNDFKKNKIKMREERKKNKSFKKMQKKKSHQESDFTLRLKKAKYWIIDFFYTYEFQILIIGILGIGIAITFVILNVIK